MTSYTHHIPGRLRTRYPQLKNNPARARIVAAAICNIDGVLSVETSAVTGSMLIRYDTHAGKREALLDALHRTKQQLGLLQVSPSPQPAPGQATQGNLAETFADKALGMIVEKCIEHSAYALFAALL